MVNASGSVIQTYDYYPFGLEMPGRSLTSGTTSRERFTGHERDEEVGLDYMQARRYAAEFGRFLSVDPLADEFAGWTPYHYVHNNPLTWIDPTGMCSSERTDPASECPENRYDPSGFAGEFTVEEVGDKIFNWLLDVAEYAVKNGPEFLDAVSESAVEMTYLTGGATIASTTIPIGVDTAVLSRLTLTSANIAFYSDWAAMVLSGLDYAIFDGSKSEFVDRVNSTLTVTIAGGPLGMLYKKQLKGSALEEGVQNAISRFAGTNTSNMLNKNRPY